MKKCLALFAAAAMLFTAQQASAQFITQVFTSGGDTGAVNITTDANLTGFCAGSTYYDSFIGLGVNDPSPAARIWANTILDPGSDTAAVSDVNLATGTLNNGNTAQFDLTGQTIDATTTICIFANGAGAVVVDPVTGNATTGVGGATPPGTVTFRDAAGAPLGTIAADFWFQDPGVNTERAPNLISFDFDRGGNPLIGRTVCGSVLTLGDIVFTTGGISDIAGFTIQTSSTDIQDVGICFPGTKPPPVVVICGDVDMNGMVNFSDIGPFIAVLSSGMFQAEADCDLDGAVTFSDIAPFIAALAGP